MFLRWFWTKERPELSVRVGSRLFVSAPVLPDGACSRQAQATVTCLRSATSYAFASYHNHTHPAEHSKASSNTSRRYRASNAQPGAFPYIVCLCGCLLDQRPHVLDYRC